MVQSSTSYQLPGVPLLFLTAPQSDLGQFLVEIRRLSASKPEILWAIEQDLEQHGLKKKNQRLADERWTSPDQLRIPDMGLVQVDEDVALRLKTGRPRMTAETCLFFWMLCTYEGGVKFRKTSDLLQESVSVRLFCQEVGIRIPGASTLAENFSALRDETRHLILNAQITLAKEEGLDDFEKCQFDSTPVDANTAWPTDSSLIWKLIRRINRRFAKLNKLGLTGVQRKATGTLVQDLRNLDFQINCTPINKPDKRNALYNLLLDDAEVASQDLYPIYSAYASKLNKANLRPSKMDRLAEIIEKTRKDLGDLDQVIQCCHERINEGINRPASEKVLSISDPDAAYMKKGNREPRIGYHPQLARSEKGLVTALIVPKGYTGDALELQSLCEQAFQRSGVIPRDTSGDGGYASKANMAWLLAKGVKNPSFSSSKGKAITPIEDWESETYKGLRNWRSAVEALMSQIKDLLDFGRTIKRGWESVRAELTDKVLAFNFIRMARLRD